MNDPFSFKAWWRAHGKALSANPEVSPVVLANQAWMASRQNDVLRIRGLAGSQPDAQAMDEALDILAQTLTVLEFDRGNNAASERADKRTARKWIARARKALES